jgi:acyl dehydratase
MMRFGTAFDLKKLRSAATPAANASAPAAPATAPQAEKLNRDYLEQSYSNKPEFVRPDAAKLYAKATNDENPRYVKDGIDGGLVAPPIFPVRLFKDVLFKLVTDPGLRADLLRLVHGEQDMVFHRPLRPWDLVATRAEVTGIEDKASGQLLKVASRAWVDGELCVEATATMFIRGKRKEGEKKEAKAEEAPERPAVSFRQEMAVAKDQPWRYAEASLDDNPIHVDEGVAKAAGFPTVILQGLCTMAFATKAVVDEACGGDPLRLRRLGVRFSKPVFPGDVLSTEGWTVEEKDGLTVIGFETRNQGGVPVIVNGLAEIAS